LAPIEYWPPGGADIKLDRRQQLGS
jgi:hypothetical protein